MRLFSSVVLAIDAAAIWGLVDVGLGVHIVAGLGGELAVCGAGGLGVDGWLGGWRAWCTILLLIVWFFTTDRLGHSGAGWDLKATRCSCGDVGID